MHDDPDDGPRSDWRRVQRALAQGSTPEQARQTLRRALTSARSDSAVIDEIATSMEAFGFSDDVILILENKCQLEPNNRTPVLHLAQALSRRGDVDRFQQTLLWAHRITTEDDRLRLETASMLESVGRLDLAIAEVRATQGWRRRNLDVLRRLARLYGLIGATTECADLWRLAVNVAGENVDAKDLTGLGIALSRAKLHDGAIRVLARALNIRRDAHTLANLGMALVEAGQPSEAIPYFQQALTIDSASVQAQFGLGVSYRITGRIQDAVDHLRAVTEHAPQWEVGFLELGIALRSLGQHQASRGALLRAAILAPDDPGIKAELRSALQPDSSTDVADDRIGASSIVGTLTSFPLEDILEFLRLQRLTGTLVLNSKARGIGQVELHRGQLVSVNLPGDEDALTRSSDPRDRRVRHTQAHNAIRELQGWREGQFSFRRADPDMGQEPADTIDLAGLMLELARQQDEKGKK